MKVGEEFELLRKRCSFRHVEKRNRVVVRNNAEMIETEGRKERESMN